MKRWRMCVVLTGLVVFTEFLLSGFSPLKAQQEFGKTPGLVPRLRWAEVDIILGRIQAVRPQFVSTKSHCSGNPLVGNRESLTVSAQPNRISLVYEYVDTQRKLTVDLNGRCLRIEQQPLGNAPIAHVRFHQLEGRPVSLQVSDRRERWSASGDNFWILLLTHRELCSHYLLPILRELHPHWKLLEKADRIEEALVRVAASGWLPDRNQWQQWVEQLASGDFSERQRADRNLRRAGQAVLRYLDGLDLKQLDAEQRLRIRHIRQALIIQDGDRPEQVAGWLIDDTSAWVSMLSHHDAHKRTAAVNHLQRICGKEIEFDPHAEPAQRQAQLTRLPLTRRK